MDDRIGEPILKDIKVCGKTLIGRFSEMPRAFYAVIPHAKNEFCLELCYDEEKYLAEYGEVGFDTPEAVSRVFAEQFPQGTPIASGSEQTIPLKHGGFTVFFISLQNRENHEKSYTYLNIQREIDLETDYEQLCRPHIHYSADRYYLSDPNGLVYCKETGEYHMFHQFAAPHYSGYKNTVNATTSWGHAVSADLMNWKQMPIALKPNTLGIVFSGTATIDRNNDSGLFDGVPPESRIMMFYASINGEDQSQGYAKISMAYTKDNGRTFIDYPNNPVVKNPGDLYGAGLRDAKVFWYRDDSYEKGGIWVMLAVGHSNFFVSENLIDWEHCGRLTDWEGNSIDSECPDLFCLPVDDDPNRMQWVFAAAGVYYILGHFERREGKKLIWVSETPKQYITEPNFTLAPGLVVTEPYATQSFANMPDGRVVTLSWLIDLVNWPGKTWNGTQTVPLENRLRTVNGKIKLTRYPAKEVDAMHDGEPICTISDHTVCQNNDEILNGIHGTCLDIQAEFTLNDAKRVGFVVRNGKDSQVKIYFDGTRNRLIVDKTALKEPELMQQCGPYSSVSEGELFPTKDGKIQIRIILDQICFEAFGNKGEASSEGYIFSDLENDGIGFYTDGEPTVDSLQIYQWKKMNRK